MSTTRPPTMVAASTNSGGLVWACAGSDVSARSRAKTACMVSSIKPKFGLVAAIPTTHDSMRARALVTRPFAATADSELSLQQHVSKDDPLHMSRERVDDVCRRARRGRTRGHRARRQRALD